MGTALRRGHRTAARRTADRQLRREFTVAQRAGTDARDRRVSCSDATGAVSMTATKKADGVLRTPAEREFAEELAALAKVDTRQKPPNWRLSPWAVVTYLIGGKLENGVVVSPKYVGQRRLMEIAVATLATDRALLLLGLPGTAKSWVSEHLAAAISGDSTLLVQGTAGTGEEAIRYSWNYARLLADGPSRSALVASPVMVGME